MDETLCTIEVLRRNEKYIARVHSQLGGFREYRGEDFEEILEQFVLDLQEEFETYS